MHAEGCLPKVFRGVTFIALGLLIACAAGTLEARQSAHEYNQLLIIRGLDHEVAVAKVPLPWGKHGLRVDGQGEVDQNEAAKELRDKGESVKPGMPVEITAIKFKSGRVTFEINGGGKTGGHWWQHLEIGMGPTPAPIVSNENPTTPSNGSYITVVLPKKNPRPTVEQLKSMLSEVLDFSRRTPTVLYAPSEPPQFKEAIKKHQVLIGMDRVSVLSAKGAPDRKIRQDKPDGSQEEDWLYGQPPHVLFVIFTDEAVTAIHQY